MLKLGVIGGSGLYELPEAADVTTNDVDTPYGKPSGPLRTRRVGGTEVVFLARHGAGHLLSPTDVPYRANIYSLKQVGVTHVVSVSAVGSLREDLPPRTIVVPDQIIDRTVARPRTFFDGGVVAHVGLADPYCPILRKLITDLAGRDGRDVRGEGTYVCIEGPQFSTRAESLLYRTWSAAVIGMTSMPEARLAREAALCYATLALVTDYDVWHDSETPVSVELVLEHLQANVAVANAIIRELLDVGLPERSCGCGDALRNAIVTAPDSVTESGRARLGIIAARYLPSTAPGPA